MSSTVPSPSQSMRYSNCAAASVGDGSTAPNFTLTGVPATIVFGLSTVPPGATFVVEYDAVAVSTVTPSVTCSGIVTGPFGPSARPTASRSSGVSVGLGPVASSNWPSLSRSHAYVAVGPAVVPVPSSARSSPSAIAYGPPASATTTGTAADTVADAVAGALVPPSLSVAVTVTVNVPDVAHVCATDIDAPPVTDCAGVPSPQLIANVKPAAGSAADGSVALKSRVTDVLATMPVGTFVTLAVGATLVIVSVDAAVDTDGPSVTCTLIASGPAGPSSSPSEVSVAAVTVGFEPVASSNWVSLSRSHAYVAVGPAVLA